MQFVLPKSGSDTGGVMGGGWEELNLPDSMSQRQQINVLSEVLSKIADKTKEIEEKRISVENSIDERDRKMDEKVKKLAGDFESSIDILKKQLEGTGQVVRKIERDTEKTSTFTIMITTAIIVVFFLAGVAVFLDYFRNNGERYEFILNKISDLEGKYGSKEDLKTLSNQQIENKNVLQCLINKGYVSKDCQVNK